MVITVDPFSKNIQSFYYCDDKWAKIFYKSLNREKAILLNNEKIRIYLTEDKNNNLIDIQIDNDFQVSIYNQVEEILRMIIEELFLDENGNINKFCTKIKFILYDLSCTDVSKINTSNKKYKNFPQGYEIGDKKIYNQRTYSKVYHDIGESILVENFEVATVGGTTSMIDLISNHSISFFFNSEIELLLGIRPFSEKSMDMLEMVSELKSRSYSNFKSSLNSDYAKELFL